MPLSGFRPLVSLSFPKFSLQESDLVREGGEVPGEYLGVKVKKDSQVLIGLAKQLILTLFQEVTTCPASAR